MFHVELAPLGGILGPLKSDLGVFWAKIPLYPYNVKTQKTHFLKTLSWADFDLLESNCRHIFVHTNQKFTIVNFFSLDACSGPMCMGINPWTTVQLQSHPMLSNNGPARLVPRKLPMAKAAVQREETRE